MLNPVVEAPAQLQAPNIDVQLEAGPVQYKAPPNQQFMSNLEGKLEARLAQVKAKSKTKPSETWDLPRTAISDEARRRILEKMRNGVTIRLKEKAAFQMGREGRPQAPSRVPEAPAVLQTKKANYEPVAAPAPKRSGRSGTSAKGRSSGRAPQQFSIVPVASTTK